VLLRRDLQERVAVGREDLGPQVAGELRALVQLVAEDTAALVRKLREELGQHDRAVEGAAATLAALARGQVEVLLVHGDPDDDRTAWFGPEPTHVATTPDDLGAMGIEAPCPVSSTSRCGRR
jgi:peptide subunit release factor 1 (eRF1)